MAKVIKKTRDEKLAELKTAEGEEGRTGLVDAFFKAESKRKSCKKK